MWEHYKLLGTLVEYNTVQYSTVQWGEGENITNLPEDGEAASVMWLTMPNIDENNESHKNVITRVIISDKPKTDGAKRYIQTVIILF